jgi:ornithine cyclodeaminase/alanine dehydrogenase-like protein (mu-crystallin family)
MLLLSADEVRALAPIDRVIEALQRAFGAESLVPPRQVVKVPGGHDERALLLMPAFDPSGAGVVKLATVFPDNSPKGLPTVQAMIVVFGANGDPVALMDGTTVTQLRTGAASALASKYLSRADSSHLVVVGTGALAPIMAAAHCAVRPISRISVCGRRQERALAARATIRSLVSEDIDVQVAGSIEQAVSSCDIVSCATSSATPVLAGAWLRPGTFVDLVGSFSPAKRETDDEVMLRGRIFVDTLGGALEEAGDLLDPLSRAVIDRRRIEGELADLVRGRIAGRKDASEITVFKSVGAAIEDLATCFLVMEARSSSACHEASSS